MQSKPNSSALNLFRPQSQAIALEQRILFDGAAAVAVDQQHSAPADAHDANDTAQTYAAPTEVATAKSSEYSAAQQLLVVDSRVGNSSQLTAQLPGNVRVLMVNTSEDGLAAISQALTEMGKVDSIQILSHGASGQFTLGNRTLSSDNVSQLSGLLSSWSASLNQGADIQLYGCNVGAGESGRVLVNELARITGADVGASSDDTGSAALGGDWTLEVRSGDVDKSLVLSADAIAGYNDLLAVADPTVSLSSGGQDVLLGDQFTFTVNFSNAATDETALGYAPYINLVMPVTGIDGDDGVNFVSATYLGHSLNATEITFDANGNATHPLAKDSSGNPLIITGNPGDKLIVISLPYGSVSKDQPPLPIIITASLSNLADTSFSNGSPDLTIQVSSGFELGSDSLNNPTSDPSIVMQGFETFVIHPTVLTFDQTLTTPENETATGPNYPQSYTTTVTPADGQTLSNIVVTQPLPNNIQVTGITPGAGGTLTSITLYDGTVITDPDEFQGVIDGDEFIASFTIEYDEISAATSTTVSFYVPDIDYNGVSVLDPVSGDSRTITIGAPSATALFIPFDPRDITDPSNPIPVSGTGDEATFIAKSLTLEKVVSIFTNVGTPSASPGDTLEYKLNVAISDYFAYGKDLLNEGSLIITDTLSNGQTFVPGSALMTVTIDGVTTPITLVPTTSTDANGVTTMVFDLAQALRDTFGDLHGWLNGDLALDTQQLGATSAVITYRTEISQAYTTAPNQPEINEGDTIGNSAILSGTVLIDRFNIGDEQSDNSSDSLTIETNTIDISIASVNDAPPPASGELRPGDIVTFEMSYDLVTGDYQGLSLTAYLPEPLLDVTGINWSQGSEVGQWSITAGNTNLGPLISVSSGPGNSVIFNFGDYDTADLEGTRIVVQFTLLVGDEPFSDQRSLDVLAQSSQQTTLEGNVITSSDVVSIVSVAEPALSITHGVVSSNNGDVNGTTGTWTAPGSVVTGTPPFEGTVTDPAWVNGDVSNIDGGDTLRLATAIENTGGGGAFDVVTSITLPAGLTFVGNDLSAANLQIYRGDGTALVLGTDYSVDGNTITFLDADGATFVAGREGTTNDNTGANLIIITYDVTVNANVTASNTLESSALLSKYASVDGGTNFTSGLTEVAGQQIAAPSISMVFADGSLDESDSSATHTTGNDLVIGESMLYDIVVTLPEGGTLNLSVDDLLPSGMQLDSSFGTGGYLLITTSAESGALGADFAGNVVVGTFTNVDGTLHFTFSTSTTNADNVTGNNSFVLRVQLIASNVLGNQAGTTLPNDAQLGYTDADGETPNGAVAVDKTVALTGDKPSVIIREPTLTIVQDNDADEGVDEGDLVTYTITITNGSTDTDFDAFDISFSDTFPSQLDSIVLVSVTDNLGNTLTGLFTLTGNTLSTVSGANIDILKGGSITITVTGTVNETAASVASFDNKAFVQWTSLDGTANNSVEHPNERTGIDGELNSGVLNDYQDSADSPVDVAQRIEIARVGGLPDTAPADPTYGPDEDVTVGEIIRYRVVSQVAEGITNDYNIRVTLGSGLAFLNDGTVRISFISSDGTMTSSIVGLVTADGTVMGNLSSGEAQTIDPNLQGPAPAGLIALGQIVSVTDPDTGITVVTFVLGNINNPDSDVDLEGISIEFNAKVLNVATNTAGTVLTAAAADYSGDGSSPLSQSKTINENIVEPSFDGVSKEVISFEPDPGSTTNTGSATVKVSFTQDGGSPAFDAHFTDSFNSAGATDYQITSITIGGTLYTRQADGSLSTTLPDGTLVPLPAGVTATDGGSIAIDFAQIDAGVSIEVIYTVVLPNNVAIANSDATLTWTSLPEDFLEWGGSPVGTDGEEGGERTGQGSGANTYVLKGGAGLGTISGTLWNDTGSANGTTAPETGETGLAGQEVTLTWAGDDGDLSTAGDNRTFTIITAADGTYIFGVLPSGNYQIDILDPTPEYDQPVGELTVRIDSDGTTGTLGQIQVTLGEGSTGLANVGYVEINDAPVTTVTAPIQNGSEDVLLDIEPITVSDIDADRYTDGTAHNLQVTLSVVSGTLSLSTPPSGVTVTGSGNSITLTGSIADLNEALKTLQYLGNQDFNGTDTLTIETSDLGNFGEADGDGIPGESTDARTDLDFVDIVLEAVNDPPKANDNLVDAVEAGGTGNGLPGVNPQGNLITDPLADTDVDIATNDDVLTVISVSTVDVAPPATIDITTSDTNGVSIIGKYGTLLVGPFGKYQYTVNNLNPEVQALRESGQTLEEQFSYTIADTASSTSSAFLIITIHGANDTPVGVDDDAAVDEAGGIKNATGGDPLIGNVITGLGDADGVGEDSDVDSAENGEQLSVSGIRNIAKDLPGDFVAVAADSTSASGATIIVGTYGTLTIGADGSYSYLVDNDNPDVEELVVGDEPLVEVFSYRLRDVDGLDTVVQLNISINGAFDNPVASDDVGQAQAASTDNSTPAIDATGNVISIASRPGNTGLPDGDGIDSDVDLPDQQSGSLTVTGIRPGKDTDPDPLTVVSAGTTEADNEPIVGQYGSLFIGADGSYTYVVDNSNTVVQALKAGETLTDTFTYEVTDTAGLTDLGQLVITVSGVNDPPVASDINVDAQETGGFNNQSPGVNPTGDVKDSVLDPDAGDEHNVTSVHTGAKDAPDSGPDTPVVEGTPTVVTGAYGTLTINFDGTFSYAVDNTNTEVMALLADSTPLTESFTYTISDGNGGFDQAQINVSVYGQNDNPVAIPDTDEATEAGGVNNNVPGTAASGNVLSNDTDEDSANPVETKAVSEFSNSAGNSGILGEELKGLYGWLRLNADGSYTYRVDNLLPAVEALRTASNTLTDVFNYSVIDRASTGDSTTLTITIHGANDAPVANNDTAEALEAGGTDNATPGSNAQGNVVRNSDTDVDANDQLKVNGVSFGGTEGTLGSSLQGQYGALILNSSGEYEYIVDNDNPDVEALLPGDVLTEEYTYTVVDLAGASSTATLTITIRGANDTPHANDDASTGIEKGGVNNTSGGQDATGNVLTDSLTGDTDVDAGDTQQVTGIRTGTETAGGALTIVAGSRSIEGTYGTLTISANGDYRYVINDSLPAVQALKAGESLTDVFTYRMRDAAGATDTAQLTITVEGAWDTPVANNDTARGVADNGQGNAINPSGNALTNDTDVDQLDSKVVTGIGLGVVNANALTAVDTGTDSTTGTTVNGQYGQLVIGADGSFTYIIDTTNTDILELPLLQTVSETFTYQVTDGGGLSATAQIQIIIFGRNDPPVANNDAADALEAGGVNNGSAGINPNGNVLSNDTDIEDKELTVIEIRTGAESDTGTAGSVGSVLRGQYGDLKLNSDGTWTYTVDNNLSAVQALRLSGQTLTDIFTYRIQDGFFANDSAELQITIHGNNDTPIANDDASVAIEAGGVANGTPGLNPSGNVLDNDTDVDSVANGESKQVLSVTGSNGNTALAGQVVIGLYGNLTINADGSYTYVLDNTNPVVQALRTAGNTLKEVFTYRMSDTAGATSDARLSITIQGADDNPVAVDDSNEASDQTTAPQSTGNVLPNDSDVDAQDQIVVTGIRTGAESASGTSGTIGQPIAGQYGTLVLNADGSYTYTIDLTNPTVLAAAGLGQILDDVFTYTISDINGATDQAELVIHLDISAPFIPAGNGPHFDFGQASRMQQAGIPDREPAVFINPVVDRSSNAIRLSQLLSRGTNIQLSSPMPFESQSIGAGLGLVDGQFVSNEVRRNQVINKIETDAMFGGAGRISLSAGGLLSNPTLFAESRDQMTRGPYQSEARGPARNADAGVGTQQADVADADTDAVNGSVDAADDYAVAPRVANGFRDQLKAAAQSRYPMARKDA